MILKDRPALVCTFYNDWTFVYVREIKECKYSKSGYVLCKCGKELWLDATWFTELEGINKKNTKEQNNRIFLKVFGKEFI